ncbi:MULTISPECIES: hypothetical protein [Bacillaceae]|nr:hypothetical protein [Rossellomorea sp. YZS02]MDX8343628.1 hypothetical protein [Rossellomorea sp. YZS02]
MNLALIKQERGAYIHPNRALTLHFSVVGFQNNSDIGGPSLIRQ